MFNFLKKLVSSGEKPYENLEADEFQERMKLGAKEVVLIDVRSQGEVNSGKIRGARNIDIMRPDFKEKVSQLDKSKTYLLYCRSGRRSARACKIMAKQGFTKLVNLKGGYMGWPY